MFRFGGLCVLVYVKRQVAGGKRLLGATALLACALNGACTKHGKATVDEPVKPGRRPAAAVIEAEPAAPVMPPPVDTCRVITKLTTEPPVYFPGKGFVVTRFMKPCVTQGGERGVEKDTPWLAMGFPCTGGSGRVDIKGHYNNPKMVSFILGTDCAMNPDSAPVVDRMAREVLDLPPDARLMAVTPFVVQYWEIPGMTDADTGFSVDLRSAPALEGMWKHFKENKPIHVKLYGRENAWVQGGHFYVVEADLKMSGRTAFQVSVTSVKSLSQPEIEEVQGRCDALRPRRSSCGDVF